MSVREMLENREREILSEKAARSSESKGRVRSENSCEIRTDFQRDRDRIIHSKDLNIKHRFLYPQWETITVRG